MAKTDNTRIVEIDVATEMQGSFLEYAYSVIYSRALPDARDGLKPVQRRILHIMSAMNLKSDRGHVKSARVVGEVMGKLHPHGDGAIYDALVRMAQPWSLRLPFIDGHGNFGSMDEGPAAYRYTEARLARAANAMVDSLDENVVDFTANYDGRELEPTVLPSAVPNLLVNGASGIAVGMATNMPPHNLREVVQAAIHLLAHPKATLSDLMNFVPGPDLPTGGVIVGIEGIKDAYQSGRGSFKMRAKVDIERTSPRRQGLVVRELPYQVGPERVIEKIKEMVTAKKLQGISDVIDLTDYESGLELVIEIKNGFNPSAVLEQLYKLTPLEETFHINNVALVNGQPLTLGLKELLEVFLTHRLDVIRRRSDFRKTKAQERLHLVEGLLTAILDIDDVIAVIRSSDDTAQARERLMEAFELSEIQTNYILEMPLRRLTKFSRIELEKEQTELLATISDLEDILTNDKRLRKVVSQELTEVAAAYGDDRRTALLSDTGVIQSQQLEDLEIPDEPCYVLLSATHLIARTATQDALTFGPKRVSHDTIKCCVKASAHSEIGVVTNHGRMIRVPVISLPTLATNSSLTVAGGSALKEFITLDKGEMAVGIVSLDEAAGTVVMMTAQGNVKRLGWDLPTSAAEWSIIKLEPKDQIVGITQTPDMSGEIVLISSDAQLLRFDASTVRATGRNAGSVSGIRLSAGASVIYGTVTNSDSDVLVATVAGDEGALPGTGGNSFKTSVLHEFPAKGRGTGGVRCHKMLSGENVLVTACVGRGPLHACSNSGAAVDVSSNLAKRDASGQKLTKPFAFIYPHPHV